MSAVHVMRLAIAVLGLTICLVGESHADDNPNFDPRYLDAVADAQQLSDSKLVTDLKTIDPAHQQGQIWKTDAAGPQILMSMFTDFTGYDRTYDRAKSQTQYHPDLWVSVAPDLWQFHQDRQTTGDKMASRTKQLLGMSLGHAGDRVVEFWVKPEDLFRPAINSNITQQVTSVADNPSDPHWSWIVNLRTTIYNPNDPYPWTQIGYTYDWGDDARPKHEGLSEFICGRHNVGDTSNLIAVEAVVSIGAYGYYNRNTSNFSVTGDCDTIWAGLRYLPAGSQIDISQSGVVYEGITVSSAGWTINNAGMILGPGRNIDNTYRDAVVEFEHGGILQNSGIIDGYRVGVYAGGTESATVANSGLICGSRYSVQSGDGNVALTNSGTLAGDVLLGSGSNTVNSSGTITGSLTAGSGTNSITNSGLITGSITTGDGNDNISLLGGSVGGNIDAGGGTNTLTVNPDAGNSVVVGRDISNVQPFTIQSGTATFNGNIGTSVTVAQGATFGGWTNIAGDLTNNGRVAQADSPGIISVAGSYSQSVGASLVAGIQKPAAGDLQHDGLTVTGNATLANNSRIEVEYLGNSHAVIQGNDRFVLLRTASGSITDAGATIACDSSFMSFSRLASDTNPYVGNNKVYTLVAARFASFASVTPAGNQHSLAAALDSDSYTATQEYAVMVNEMLFMTGAEFRDAIAGLSPKPYFAVSAATNRTTQYLAESTADYLRTRRNHGATFYASNDAVFHQGLGVRNADLSDTVRLPNVETVECSLTTLPTRPACDRFGFVDPFGIFYGERSTDDRVGFQANSVGSRFGVDQRFTDHAIVGIGAAYVNSQLTFNENTGNGRIDSFIVGPYFSWFGERWYLDSSITGGFHNNEIHRNLTAGSFTGREDADYSANDIAIYLGAGQDVLLDQYTLSPMASLQYIYYRGAEFTETGLAGPALTVLPQDSNSLRSRLGARMMRVVSLGGMTLVPEVNCGWAHEFLADDDLDARFALGVASFATDPGGVFRDAGYFGCSATLSRGLRTTLFVRYQGELSNGGVFNAGNVGLAIGF